MKKELHPFMYAVDMLGNFKVSNVNGTLRLSVYPSNGALKANKSAPKAAHKADNLDQEYVDYMWGVL